MVKLHFKKCYVPFILNEQKTTTCRIGDKSKRFKVGRKVQLTTGSRYKPIQIAEVIITQVKVKQFRNLTFHDLVGESPDCRTVNGLYCVMYHINNVLLQPEDLVTLITWKLIP